MIKSGIYQITNVVNGMIYIGSSYHITNRWKNHRIELTLNRHSNRYLQSAWNKYGEINFTFEVIEPVEIDLLIEREQYWLDATQCHNREIGYNLSPTASTCLGVKHTDETKAKLSSLRKGKPRSEEVKAKIAAAMKGRKFSEETRAKMSAAQTGKKKSEEFKELKRQELIGNQINKGRKQSKDHIAFRLLSISVPCSDEKKEKIRLSNLGQKRSDESRAKMSAAAKARWATLKS